jgi:Carboxypeptidase regulatory-like domain
MRSSLNYFSFIILLLATIAHAQVDTGSISGAVKDASGAIVQDASITVVNPSSGSTVTANTNKEGLYTVVNLRAGNYNVSATAPGFQTITKSGIDVRLQDRIAVDFELQIGETSTSVEVQTTGPLL